MTFVLSQLFLASVALAVAPGKGKVATPVAAFEIPIVVQYLKTGREDNIAAEKLGQIEVENSNPCVMKMRRDLEKWAGHKEMKDAVAIVSRSFPISPGPRPYLVLRYMNESMELRFEMRGFIDNDSEISSKPNLETVKLRRGIFLSNRPATWRERMQEDRCNIKEDQFTALIDELREADRLASCLTRKKELMESAQKISNYLHNYTPVNWIEEARQRLAVQNMPVTELLREDPAVYREGNSSYRECAKGLKLLEEEASASVRVLNEVREVKKGTDVPARELEDLERRLTNTVK